MEIKKDYKGKIDDDFFNKIIEVYETICCDEDESNLNIIIQAIDEVTGDNTDELLPKISKRMPMFFIEFVKLQLKLSGIHYSELDIVTSNTDDVFDFLGI